MLGHILLDAGLQHTRETDCWIKLCQVMDYCVICMHLFQRNSLNAMCNLLQCLPRWSFDRVTRSRPLVAPWPSSAALRATHLQLSFGKKKEARYGCFLCVSKEIRVICILQHQETAFTHLPMSDGDSCLVVVTPDEDVSTSIQWTVIGLKILQYCRLSPQQSQSLWLFLLFENMWF